MLYDPKWEQKTRTDPFSFESLIAWLEKQPAQMVYKYVDSKNCIIAQWRRAMGAADIVRFIPDELGWRFWKVAALWPHTFGGALERAHQIAAQTKGL